MSDGRRLIGPTMIALMCFMFVVYEATAVARIMEPYTEDYDVDVFWQRAPREEILKVRRYMFSIGSMVMLASIALTGRIGHLIP
jgi:hypothetical protein